MPINHHFLTTEEIQDSWKEFHKKFEDKMRQIEEANENSENVVFRILGSCSNEEADSLDEALRADADE